MLPRAYLQALDTVAFDPSKHPGGSLRAEIDESFAKAMIYSAFYEVALAPNQVLDLSMLRQKYIDPSKDLEAYPFTLSVSSKFIKNPTPFTDHLLFILRYEGENAFLFSSLHDSVELKKNWGAFTASEGKNISDKDILIEAKKTAYVEIVEWAEKLDSMAKKLNIIPYEPSQVMDYQGVFRSFLDSKENLGWLPNLPKNRSAAYELIDNAITDDNVKTLAKHIPDFISNVLYAKATNSRLSIESNSPLDIDPAAEDKLRIDFKGLFSKYNFAFAALVGANYTDLSKARKKASKYMLEGWSLETKEPENALKLFGKGMKEFLGDVVAEKYSDTLMNIGIPAPITASVNVPASFIAKLKLNGLDKFINFK